MIICPNKNLKEWTDLVAEHGEDKAYIEFYKNNFNIPERVTNEPTVNRFGDMQDSVKLSKRLGEFLDKIGVTLKSVQNITDSDGNKLDANAQADLVHKTIEVVEGREHLSTLPEEASHFFVEILKQNNSPLYKSMMSEIGSYDLYKDVVGQYGDIYKGNTTKLKEEAVAQLISQHILDNFQDIDKQERAGRWYNRVLDFVKSIFGKLTSNDKFNLEGNIITNNPFSESANRILGKYGFDGINTSNFTDEESKTFYQLTQGSKLEDRINEKYDIEKKGENYQVIIDNKPVEVKSVLDKGKEKTSYQKEIDRINDKGHQDIKNIFDRALADRNGKIKPSRVINTNEAVYSKLENYVNRFIQDIPADSKIINQADLYDSAKKLGSTVDLIVNNANGKTDLYNFKFNNYGKNKVNSFSRESGFGEDLRASKDILQKEYGVTNFGKVRTIPIEIELENKVLNNIKINTEDNYLQPIPITEELTGDDKLDRVLGTLVKDKTKLEDSKPAGNLTDEQRDAFLENKYSKLNKIAKAIRDIQLHADLKEYVNIGLSAINDLATTPINDYTSAQLVDLTNTMKFYGKNMLGLIADKVADFSINNKAELNRLVTESQLWDSKLQQEVESRLLATSNPDILDPQKESGVYNRMFRTISQQQHPIIQKFYSLVQSSKAKTRNAVTEINENIKNAVQRLQEAQPDKSGTGIFDYLIKTKANGERTIVPKFSEDFYSKLNDYRGKLKGGTPAEKAESLNWLKRNTTFDEKAYNERYKAVERTLNKTYRNDVDKNDKISQRLLEFRGLNDDINGRSNPKNPFIKPNETDNTLSTEYKNIQSKPSLKEFYDLWMKHSKDAQDYIGQDLGGRFIWNVPASLIEGIKENGLGSFTNMESVLSALEARPGDTLGMIDPETGKPLYKLPTYYTEKNLVKDENGKWIHDNKEQSKDLGKVLSLVSAMAHNHKYMGEIEADAHLLEMTLANQETILTDNNGNPIKNQLTNQVAKAVGSANTLEQYRDYMNYYLYDVKDKTKDLTFKVGGNTYSSLAIYNGFNKWFVGKTLSANPISIMSHAIRGETNTRIIASMGRFFNNSQYTKAMGQLATRDKKSYTLAGYFDLLDGANFHKQARDLSANSLEKVLNYDNMFIGHRGPDFTVRNGILLSMLHSHTLEDGKIIKIGDNVKDKTSLFDLIELKNNSLDFKDISKDQIEAFRNKVSTVGDRVFGMNTRDDMKAAQLNILARSLLTFRNWIPGMVDTRYRALSHNNDLGEYELGRYRTFWNNVTSKHFLPIIADGLKRFATFGYGGKFGDAVIENAKELYAQMMEQNPNSKMTEQQYIDLHLANMRGNMMETYILAAMIGAVVAVKPDKDEKLETGSLRKWFSKQMDRSLADLSFFYNPAEFNKIIKSPVPLMSAYTDLYNLGTAVVHKGEESVGMNPKVKDNEFRKASFKVVPGLSGFESLLSFADPNYDSSAAYTSESSSK